MAEDKKSFLLYADLIHTVKKLPREKIGDLFLTILEYVNDINPTVDDILVDIAFEPIKQQLKRDLRQWEEKIEVRSTNGSLGNLKRWNNDLYIQVTESKITLEEAINIANGRKKSHSDNGDIKLSQKSQTVANVAVNVNDNVINKDIYTNVGTLAIDFDKFINGFNSFAGRSFKATEKVKASLKARLKEYSKTDILKAIENAHKDEYHIETNFKYLTPEFILRPDKIEKFLNAPTKSNINPHTRGAAN
jgi:uncharacterized phage protein (TIGR02220 family)